MPLGVDEHETHVARLQLPDQGGEPGAVDREAPAVRRHEHHRGQPVGANGHREIQRLAGTVWAKGDVGTAGDQRSSTRGRPDDEVTVWSGAVAKDRAAGSWPPPAAPHPPPRSAAASATARTADPRRWCQGTLMKKAAWP
jgi:hypothetical protein